MLPIFESLCEEHTTTRVAFVMVKKDDLPGLCVEHQIPRSTNLTFAAFKNECKVGMTDGTHSEDLEIMVQRHIRPTAPRSTAPRSTAPRPTAPRSTAIRARGREQASCDCCDHRARTHSLSSRSDHIVARPQRPARSPSRHRVPFTIDWPNRRSAPRNATLPADLTYVDRRGPLPVERPMEVEYLGRDGRYRRTDDVRLQRTPRGAEATYLDQSGPIAIERTIGRWSLSKCSDGATNVEIRIRA